MEVGMVTPIALAVHLRTYLNNEHKLQTGDMNRINAAMLWIKVYLDEDGDVAIEMDVHLPKNASSQPRR